MAEAALAKPLPVDPSDFEQFVFLGHGWTVGLAAEAALKFREAAGAWTEAYPAMEYRHGPISVGRSGNAGVVARTEPEPDLVADVRATGASIIESELDPMAELVTLQRVAVALAEARGLDPDRPRTSTGRSCCHELTEEQMKRVCLFCHWDRPGSGRLRRRRRIVGSSASGGHVNIVIWHGYTGAEANAMKVLTKEFNATHPEHHRDPAVLRQLRLRASEGPGRDRRRQAAGHLLSVWLVGGEHRHQPQPRST